MTVNPPPPPAAAHPEGLPTGQVVEPLILLHGNHEVVVGVHTPAPNLTVIGVHMLDELAAHRGTGDQAEVLTLPGGHRYLIGAAVDGDPNRVYLHRIPAAGDTHHAIADLVCRTAFDTITGVTRVIVDHAPPRAAITRDMLRVLTDPTVGGNGHMRQQTSHGDTLVLPGGTRYLIGVPIDDHRLLLRRLDDEVHPLVG